MKAQSLLAGIFLFYTTLALGADYPSGPDSRLTPGHLCEDADETRYPERIKYCRRSVESEEKEAVVAKYDRILGYRVGAIGRNRFKIDHYIPLCMGGSNEAENLWPQHLSISLITDPLEEDCCLLMAQGKIKQAEAVELIREGKNDLELVPTIRRELEALEPRTRSR